MSAYVHFHFSVAPVDKTEVSIWIEKLICHPAGKPLPRLDTDRGRRHPGSSAHLTHQKPHNHCFHEHSPDSNMAVLQLEAVEK
jgi:hypothetical protein